MAEVDIQVVAVELSDSGREALEHDAQRLLDHLGEAASLLSLVVGDDAFIRPLNRDYRGKDSATDVLSFPQREGEGARADDPVLGDLVISLETAARQAAELDHSVSHELRVLLVHGLLHLLGHDHIEAQEAARMQAAEAELLAVLGEGGRSLVARAHATEGGTG